MFLYLQISSIRSLFLCFIVLKMSCSSSQTVIARVLWDYERNICAFCFRAFSEICVWSEVRREDSEWQAETETKWVGKMKVRQTKKQKIDGEINNNECDSAKETRMNEVNTNSQTRIIQQRFVIGSMTEWRILHVTLIIEMFCIKFHHNTRD